MQVQHRPHFCDLKACRSIHHTCILRTVVAAEEGHNTYHAIIHLLTRDACCCFYLNSLPHPRTAAGAEAVAAPSSIPPAPRAAVTVAMAAAAAAAAAVVAVTPPIQRDPVIAMAATRFYPRPAPRLALLLAVICCGTTTARTARARSGPRHPRAPAPSTPSITR